MTGVHVNCLTAFLILYSRVWLGSWSKKNLTQKQKHFAGVNAVFLPQAALNNIFFLINSFTSLLQLPCQCQTLNQHFVPSLNYLELSSLVQWQVNQVNMNSLTSGRVHWGFKFKCCHTQPLFKIALKLLSSQYGNTIVLKHWKHCAFTSAVIHI